LSQILKPKKGYKLVKGLFGKSEEIPEEWNYAKIEDFCKKITSGGTPNRKNSTYFEGEIPWIKSGELNDNFISISDEKITQTGLDDSSAKLFPKNTVLIAMYGATIGKTAIIKKESTTNQAICAILPDNSFDSFYLQQLLISKRKILISFGMGAGQPNINQEIIRTFHILLPPLDEQQKISAILSNVNNLITNTKKIINQTKFLKKGLMQKLLTKGISHKKFKKVSLGGQILIQIPELWTVSTLESISDGGTQNGLAISISDYGKGVPIVGMTKFYSSEILTNDNMKEVVLSPKNKELFSLKSFDLLFGRRSMDGSATGGAGKCIIVSEMKTPVIFESSVIRMSIKKEHNPFFIYQLFQSPLGKRIRIRIIRVSAVSGISSGDLKKIKIPIPSKTEQDDIVSILSNVDSQIQSQTQHREKLERLKKSLMQKLLTGQVRAIA